MNRPIEPEDENYWNRERISKYLRELDEYIDYLEQRLEEYRTITITVSGEDFDNLTQYKGTTT